MVRQSKCVGGGKWGQKEGEDSKIYRNRIWIERLREKGMCS